MDLNPRIKRLAGRLLPGWLVRYLDPVETAIRRHVEAFARNLPSGARVLDAGCGEARFRPLFDGKRYVGYDSAVGDARWDYSRVDVVGDLAELALGDDTVDAALLVVVLEHVRHPARVLSEVERVLRPGGRLYVAAPLLWEVHQAPHDYFRFTRHGLELLLAEAGFTVTRLEPMGGFFTLSAHRCVNGLTFFQRGWRWPFFFLLAPFFGLLFPALLRLLDPLDRDRHFTLGYHAWAEKPERIQNPESRIEFFSDNNSYRHVSEVKN